MIDTCMFTTTTTTTTAAASAATTTTSTTITSGDARPFPLFQMQLLG